MSYKIDFTIASSHQIESALCRRIESIRLSRNITQGQIAYEAGISERTVRRLENGEGVSMDTFIRVMTALGIQQNFEILLPDPSVRPVERIKKAAEERKRARPAKSNKEHPKWTWGEADKDDE